MANITGVTGVAGGGYAPAAPAKTDVNEANKNITNPIDTFTPDAGGISGLYSKGDATIQKLWDETLAATQALRNIVSALLSGGKVDGRFGFKHAGEGQITWARRAENPEIDPELAAEAQALIGEDGYYGVKQTTARIMDFARALAGESYDAQTISDLRAGVQMAFDDVARMFGGFEYLPEVTKQTYEAIMKAFDDWQAGLLEE
jgi:hypothetical protein